jgi:threonine/homoserine/homoserine lactone efflux protein
MVLSLFHFLLFAFSQIATPGPANMIMLSTGAKYGFHNALPFVFGVIVGKQIIIWPIGFGLMLLNKDHPYIFIFFKYISAGYILWLAWRIANMRISEKTSDRPAPSFLSGLIVHPLNPKAWALITTGFTNFVDPTSPVLYSTATVAFCLFGVQVVCHPIWTLFGERIAILVSGSVYERYLMLFFAGLTVIFVSLAIVSS